MAEANTVLTIETFYEMVTTDSQEFTHPAVLHAHLTGAHSPELEPIANEGKRRSTIAILRRNTAYGRCQDMRL